MPASTPRCGTRAAPDWPSRCDYMFSFIKKFARPISERTECMLPDRAQETAEDAVAGHGVSKTRENVVAPSLAD
jgi:hypothetical protein